MLVVKSTQILPCHICSRCQKYIGVSDGMLLVEKLESRADLECRFASGNYRIILLLMKLSVKHPEVKSTTVSSAERSEPVEAVKA